MHSATATERIESREAVHRVMCRYMELCDVPSVEFSVEELASLFTPDAVWEGIGAEYARKFGTRRGRPEIVGMLTAYLPPNSHFRGNVHLLGSEQIDVDGPAARGRWIMQQLSRYEDESAELLIARITAECEVRGGIARIKHFTTEKLFVTRLDEATRLLESNGKRT
ncbi:nuclear transport factor 2 family protein [Rhodococcus opacus]|uniref:nuclear transport factor 2 family protein n=1 Tax=Rhodococcus opacus TaxID=37919 RepID=UPI00146E3FDE|nr:nuclear transport factor 2 family protein [Rhodococcus opacus]